MRTKSILTEAKQISRAVALGRRAALATVAGNAAAEPPGFPASLISGSGGMPWTAESVSPVIHLSWHGQRRIGSLIVRPARGLPSTPQTVTITSPDGTRQASIGAGGLVRWPAPLTTDRIDVSFPRVRQATIVTATGQLATLPVRLSQLSVPALAGLRAVTPDQQARFTLACGQGPALTVDGRAYRTSVNGTLGELSGYLPLPVRVCSPGGTLSLASVAGAGEVQLSGSEAMPAAGMARGTIYSNVNDLDGLFEEVAAQLVREMAERVTQGMVAIDDPATPPPSTRILLFISLHS